MTGDELLEALQLPSTATAARRRVAKSLLEEHGAATAADRRAIKAGIERIQWLAALTPDTVGVASYRDEQREYNGIVVVHIELRPGARVSRLLELLHHAMPHPAVIMLGGAAESAPSGMQASTKLSAAHKRWSRNEQGKTVLDGDLLVTLSPTPDEPFTAAFTAALALARQPATSMLSLYQGWIDTLQALEAARRTGAFVLLAEAGRRSARDRALRQCTELDARIKQLRAAAGREKQMPRRVELNLEIRRAEAERAAATEDL